MIPSHRPELVKKVIRAIRFEPYMVIDGTDAPSFSWLVNQTVLKCPTETVIICADKCRPRGRHIRKMRRLLDKGFGLAGMYRFGFFGFHKELFRKIGPMDERYIGGNYEDDDFVHRMKEANIAYYESEEVPYRSMRSSWDITKTREVYESKWDGDRRLLPELPHGYDFGPSIPRTYLPWTSSILLPNSAHSCP